MAHRMANGGQCLSKDKVRFRYRLSWTVELKQEKSPDACIIRRIQLSVLLAEGFSGSRSGFPELF